MSRTVDFDSFRAEQHQDPVLFIIGGETYELPASLPAAVAVDVIRLHASEGDAADVKVEDLNVFGSAIFGPALWREILDKHRIGTHELSPLLEKVLEVYSENPKEKPAKQPALTSPTKANASA